MGNCLLLKKHSAKITYVASNSWSWTRQTDELTTTWDLAGSFKQGLIMASIATGDNTNDATSSINGITTNSGSTSQLFTLSKTAQYGAYSNANTIVGYKLINATNPTISIVHRGQYSRTLIAACFLI